MLTVITGPPCSGKSTEALKRHRPGAVLVDYDRIAQALGSPTPHDHPDPIRWVATEARKAAITEAIRQHHAGAHVVIVQTRIRPDDLERYRQAGADIVTLTADPAVLHARADAERPARWHHLIDQWTGVDMADLDSREYRRLCTQLRAQAIAYCRLCNGGRGPIRYDAPPRTPLSFSVNHLVPRSRGGSLTDPANLEPSHYGCNSGAGNRPTTGQLYTSEAW